MERMCMGRKHIGKKSRMRTAHVLLPLLLCISFLAGCGDDGDSGDGRKSLVGLVVRSEEQEIPYPEGYGVAGWYLLGRQFYQGEAVQIWGVRNASGGMDISLYHEDGSREELLAGAPLEYGCPWFLDSEGRRFLLVQGRTGAVVRLDGEGGEVYRRQGDAVEDICELADGRILAVLRAEDGARRLAELNPDTGVTSDIKAVELAKGASQFIGAGKEGMFLLDGGGLWKVSLQSGSRECLMSFGGAYSPGGNVEDFRVLEDGRLEVLQSGGKLQKVELSDPVGDREVIVVRKEFFNPEMEQYAFLFNQLSGEYYVYLDACPEGTDVEDFACRTLVELGTGKGPDIICAVLDPWELAGNGYLEDLAPWMEGAGIREEDYFPAAFAYPRMDGAIYGVNYRVTGLNFYISRELLGEEADPDIGQLVEALRDYGGEGVAGGWNAALLLEYFLRGSEDLWGMLDWEAGSCDFGGELFAGMLEAAKRYADDGKGARPVLMRRGESVNYYDCGYDRQRREEEGMAEVNFFFDDGRHAMNSNYLWMAVSSSSPNKEGAWEFLRFLLSDEVQMQVQEYGVSWYPVSRKCFEETARQAVAEGAFVQRKDAAAASPGWTTKGSYGELYSALGREEYKAVFGPTEEKVGIVRSCLEDVRPFPLRTEPILDIVYEEAVGYFSGQKSIGEVVEVIQNRVQLYLGEHK